MITPRGKSAKPHKLRFVRGCETGDFKDVARSETSREGLPPHWRVSRGHHVEVSYPKSMRADLRYLAEEPSSGKPHARICEVESRAAERLDALPPPLIRRALPRRANGTNNLLRQGPQHRDQARAWPIHASTPGERLWSVEVEMV